SRTHLYRLRSSFFFHCARDPPHLPPFPTRRSSDLAPSANAATRTSRARYAPSSAADAATLRMGMTAQVQLRQPGRASGAELPVRSEEHTSELQSRENLVCRLLLEKKNKTKASNASK